MPTIVLRERQDRNTPVTVNISTKSGDERCVIERNKTTKVSANALEVLKQSHEAPFIIVLDEK